MDTRAISKEDVTLIGEILDHAEVLDILAREQRPRMVNIMCAVHACLPLKLREMRRAAHTIHSSDFAHDIAGMWNHWDLTEGVMRDCFMPRFAI